MVENLIQVLTESKYHELTIEELAIIQTLDSLKRPFIKAFIEGRVSIKNIPARNIRIRFCDDELKEEEKRDFYYNMFEDLFPKYGFIRKEFAQTILTAFDFKEHHLTDADLEELLRNADEKTKDPNAMNSDLIFPLRDIDYDEYINILLNYKRYDLISKNILQYNNFVDNVVLKDETYQRILNDFPFDEYEAPTFLTSYLVQHDSDLIDLKKYIEYVHDGRIPLKKEDIYKLMDKATREEIDNMPQEIDKYYSIRDLDDLEVFNYILSKNQLVFIHNYELNNYPDLLNEYLKVIEYRLKNDLPVNPDIIKEYYRHFANNEEVQKIILNSKYLLYLNSYYIEDHLDLLKIDFDKEDIDLGYININVLLSLPEEVFDKLIQKANYSKPIKSIDYITDPQYRNKLFKLINSNIEIQEIRVSEEVLDREMLISMINNEKFTAPHSFRRIFQASIFNRLLSETDLAIAFMEKYPNEVGGIFNIEYLHISKHPQIMKYIYTNKYYMEILLETLERWTEEQYTEEIYEHGKNYLKEEYGIDTDSLDRLKALAGPSVLRYAFNENVQTFLKLSAEEQTKILELFPRTIYNSGNVEATFESIIQYAFSKNRREDANIFSDICHAIYDRDVIELNTAKCKILALITEEEFQKIKSSESITESSLEEYLNKLFDEIRKGNNLTEVLEKLHHITNIYILNARQEYHSDYLYFIDNKNFVKGEFLDFQKIVDMIGRDEELTFDNNYTDEEIVEIMNLLKEKYDMSEYQNCPPDLFLLTLVSHINVGINGNENVNISNSMKILKYIIDYNNIKYKKENPTTIESLYDMPYRIEKKAFQGHLDKEILSNAKQYYLGETSLYNLLSEKVKTKGINNYILTLAINYYADGKQPPGLDQVKTGINEILSGLKITDPKTGKVIENCNVDYLLNHIEEIADYDIEDDFAWFPRKEKMATYLASSDSSKYTIVDVIHAIKNNQIRDEHIKGAIKNIIGEYKKIVKNTNELKSSHNGLNPMENFYDGLIYAYKRYVVIRDDDKLIPASKYIEQELLKRGYDEVQILNLRTNTRVYNDEEIPQINKDYMEIMKSLFENDQLYFTSGSSNSLLKRIEDSSSKKKYVVPQSEKNIMSIIDELNIGLLQKTILNNPELYEELKTLIETKKIHSIPELIDKAIDNLDLPIGPSAATIGGFISYYSLIKQEIEKENEVKAQEAEKEGLKIEPKSILDMTFMDIMKKGEKYGGVPPVFKEILSSEDARLIKENPGQNSATEKLKNNERLTESITQTISNYKRESVTVPPFDENVTVGEKEVNIVVGNFTDHTNLTHAERTGSCMRLGGAGEKLYYFALNNENGFHIRFEEPDTHEYITRATGFRNGNTVFLNQLRYSCLANYTNEDVVEACKKAARLLIEKSKDSTCPIENVVITNAYAMSETDDKIIDFNIDNPQEGLPTFYSDIANEGIVLATTAEAEELVPINFDKTNIPRYLPQRGKIITGTNYEQMQEKIQRVVAIKKLSEGENYDELGAFEFTTGFIYGTVSDDWYVYIDDEKNIVYDIINLDPRAQEELKTCIEEMQDLAKSKFIEMEAFEKNGGKNKNR